MWKKFRAWIGDLWGKATTQILAIGVILQTALTDPTVASFVTSVPWLPRAIGVLAIDWTLS